MKKTVLCTLILLFSFLVFYTSVTAQEKIELPEAKYEYQTKADYILQDERAAFMGNLERNSNYYGNDRGSENAPVKIKKHDTTFEQLREVGLYTKKDILEAFVDVKLPTGYNSGLCYAGSYEYVRFYADWNNDGDYTDEDEDLGLGSVNVHNIPNTTNLCLGQTKPLTYTVTLEINPPKYQCKIENLVKIKAILSWQQIPPANQPNFSPVWGNVMERWVQIDPVIFLQVSDVLDNPLLYKIAPNNNMYYMEIPEKDKYIYNTKELLSKYKREDVPEYRVDFEKSYKKVQPIMENSKMSKLEIKPDDYITSIKEILPDLIYDPISKSSKYFEELNEVGLKYDSDELTASITVKRPGGYGGDLCSTGSYEYIAFWLYVPSFIGSPCRWEHMGTAQINVHDISSIPPEGLEYAVKMKTNLEFLKRDCSLPRVVYLKGILSWGKKPPKDNPYYTPLFGNHINTQIQIRPGGSTNGKHVPFISKAGEMAVAQISGNPHTTTFSSIGDGYANGISVNGYQAIESPFGGRITIGGHIANAPDLEITPNKIQYKVQYKKITGSTTWHTLSNSFWIWISTYDDNTSTWTQSLKKQKYTGGYYSYEEDLQGDITHFVEDDVLAQWNTPVPEGDGLYQVRVLVKDPMAPIIVDVPAGHRVSNVVRIRVDNTKPTAIVELDEGDCFKYYVGDDVSGSFTATDKHIWKYTLRILPHLPWPAINPSISPNGAIYPDPGFSSNGIPFGSYTIDTDASPSCGYVVRVYVWDRAIINNHFQGNRAYDDVGFCLLD